MAPKRFIPSQCAIDRFVASFVPQIFTLVDSISASSGTSYKAFRAYLDKYVIGDPVSTIKWIDIAFFCFPSGSTGKQIIGRAWGPNKIPDALLELF